MTPTEIIRSQADAARGILEDFGPEKAMGYLIGEKFLNFLEVAETDRQWQEAIPAFVAEIKALFEPLQLAEFLNTPRRLGALGHVASEEGHRMFREETCPSSFPESARFCFENQNPRPWIASSHFCVPRCGRQARTLGKENGAEPLPGPPAECH